MFLIFATYEIHASSQWTMQNLHVLRRQYKKGLWRIKKPITAKCKKSLQISLLDHISYVLVIMITCFFFIKKCSVQPVDDWFIYQMNILLNKGEGGLYQKSEKSPSQFAFSDIVNEISPVLQKIDLINKSLQRSLMAFTFNNESRRKIIHRMNDYKSSKLLTVCAQ